MSQFAFNFEVDEEDGVETLDAGEEQSQPVSDVKDGDAPFSEIPLTELVCRVSTILRVRCTDRGQRESWIVCRL